MYFYLPKEHEESLKQIEKEIREADAKSKGVTILDYFATAALQGCLSHAGNPSTGSFHNNSTPELTAKTCFDYAEAMMRERMKRKT